MKKVLLKKSYSDEELYDIERDINECFDDPEIEKDEHGFSKGQYEVSVVYVEDE